MSICHQISFNVENCSFFCPTTSSFLSGEKKALCIEAEAAGEYAKCECIRPFFPDDGECLSALHFIGAEWIIPILASEVLLKLYNILYAVFIFRARARRSEQEIQTESQQCCKCNFVCVGLFCVFGMEVARLVAQAMDPYYFVDVMPNGIAYVLNYISYALMIAALCFVFLSFNKAVYSQSSEDGTDNTIQKRNWPKVVIIILAIVGIAANLSRQVVTHVFRDHVGDQYEHILDSAFNGMNLFVLLFSLVLMTVEARYLQLYLRNFTQTFQRRNSQADNVFKIDEINSVINRYFYLTMGLGFVALVVFLLYSVCLGNMGPWVYFLSWAIINTLQSFTTLVMLFNLEGQTVPSFPYFSCKCKERSPITVEVELPAMHACDSDP